MTVCVECKHLQRGRALRTQWDYLCGAVKRLPGRDPVTGLDAFLGTNDLGGTYYTDDEWPSCRSINKGECSFFEEAQTDA
jgi:hypothetical protein